jgi:hypothetical protein
MPKSATAALDLEIEKIYASKESPVGIPKLIKNPKGMISFKEWMSSKEEK